jgi:hypothetical protein
MLNNKMLVVMLAIEGCIKAFQGQINKKRVTREPKESERQIIGRESRC